MPEILIPLTFEDLPVRPPLVGRPKISEDIQQTAALLVGWDKTTRRLVRVTPSGVLYVAQARVKKVINKQSTGAGSSWSGDNIPTSEVLLKSKTGNSALIWVNFSVAAGVNVGYPLDSGEKITVSINNLNNLHLYFNAADDWAVIIYSR